MQGEPHEDRRPHPCRPAPARQVTITHAMALRPPWTVASNEARCGTLEFTLLSIDRPLGLSVSSSAARSPRWSEYVSLAMTTMTCLLTLFLPLDVSRMIDADKLTLPLHAARSQVRITGIAALTRTTERESMTIFGFAGVGAGGVLGGGVLGGGVLGAGVLGGGGCVKVTTTSLEVAVR